MYNSPLLLLPLFLKLVDFSSLPANELHPPVCGHFLSGWRFASRLLWFELGKARQSACSHFAIRLQSLCDYRFVRLQSLCNNTTRIGCNQTVVKVCNIVASACPSTAWQQFAAPSPVINLESPTGLLARRRVASAIRRKSRARQKGAFNNGGDCYQARSAIPEEYA